MNHCVKLPYDDKHRSLLQFAASFNPKTEVRVPKSQETLAAIDLGSNSFHMLLARIENEQIQIVDRYKEMVRLAGGLDEKHNLTAEAQAIALGCLERFGQRIEGLKPGNVRVVGTNALRQARNSSEFLTKAEAALGHSIDVISGMEEARLIYLGVAHSLPSDQGKRLVIDIGGGSTEVIIGEGFHTLQRESLPMGCVRVTKNYFADGKVTEPQWEQAVAHAKLELLPLIRSYSEMGWDVAIGASGTMRSVADVQQAMGWSNDGMTMEGMRLIQDALLACGDIEKLELKGLSDERKPVFAGGAAVVSAIFEAFRLDRIRPSQGALREGVLYDLSGRRDHEDVRGRTIDHLLKRFHIDFSQAERVMQLLIQIIELGSETLALDDDDIALVLWAAELHEIGLAVAHSQAHKHGAYLIEHADMPGFSQKEQRLLAVLIRAQRRSIRKKLFSGLNDQERLRLLKLLALLRVSLVLRRSRSDRPVPVKKVKWTEDGLTIRLDSSWLAAHPLTQTDLSRESTYFKSAGIKFRVKSAD